ncbi:MAG: response regulator [Planctomycetota bacterium]
MDNFVLVVDDEAHIRRIVALQLRRAGLEVELAMDGKEALDVIRERLPDLVITDCQMPRMDGLSLCEALARDDETSNVPILLLTAKGFELEEEDLRARGNIVGLLCKPFSPDQLLQTVESALRIRGNP